MNTRTKFNLILLLLGFLVSALSQDECEQARNILNGLPKGPIVSKEDALNRWSKLHPAIDMIKYSMSCIRASYFCDVMITDLRNASNLPSEKLDFSEYLWRESTFKVINASCFAGTPKRVPTVNTEGLVCESRLKGIISKFTSVMMEISESKPIVQEIHTFLNDSKCVQQDCPACKRLIEFLERLSTEYFSNGQSSVILAYVQFVSEVTKNCALTLHESKTGYCQAVESSAEKAEKISKALTHWSDTEILSRRTELQELVLSVLTTSNIQGHERTFCTSTIKTISKLFSATFSSKTNTFEENFALLRPNLLLWIQSCAVSQPSKVKLPQITFVPSSDQCSITRNAIMKRTQAFAELYNDRSQINADPIFEGAVKKLADGVCIITSTSCSIIASFTKDLSIKPATEDPQELRERLFLYAGNLIRYTNLCFEASSAPNTSNHSSHNCKGYAQSVIRNIGRALEDPVEFYSLMTFLRGQKGQVESFAKCMDQSFDLKTPGFCKDLTKLARELYVRVTFSPSMDALKQSASALLDAFEDIIYECDL